MTIRTLRDHGQHYRPRMACIKNVEAFVVEMQDPKSGVKGADQKLNITTIPYVINGESRDSQHQMAAPLRDISPKTIPPPPSLLY
uniref:Uncharacterized protein n=1 Tax=Hucho hucho TaxID=62062 RepID=A0A4W5MKE0_9TELE